MSVSVDGAIIFTMEDTNHPLDVRDVSVGRPLLGRHWPRKQQPKEEGRTKGVRSSYSRRSRGRLWVRVCLFFVVPGSRVVGNPERTSDEGAMAREMEFNSD